MGSCLSIVQSQGIDEITQKNNDYYSVYVKCARQEQMRDNQNTNGLNTNMEKQRYEKENQSSFSLNKEDHNPPQIISKDQIKIQILYNQTQSQQKEISQRIKDYEVQKMMFGEQLYEVQIDDMSLPLHQTIVALVVRVNRSKSIVGSGVRLSKNCILTSAHNIFDKTTNPQQASQPDKNKVQIYLNGNGDKYYQVEDWRYLKQFKKCKKQGQVQFDYAIIKIKQNHDLPQCSQYLPISLPCSCVLNKEPFLKLQIYGYPKIQKNYAPKEKQGTNIKLTQFGLSKKNSIYSIQKIYLLKHLVSTFFGQSGCCIVVNNRIIAVHTGGIQKQYNIGRLIDGSFIKNIKIWLQQLKCDQITFAQCPNCQRMAENYEKQFNFEKALQISQRLLYIRDVLRINETIQTGYLLQKIGRLYYYQFNYAKALQNYEIAQNLYKRIKGQNCLQIADILSNIGLIGYYQMNFNEALQNYQKALQIYKKLKKEQSFQAAHILNKVSLVHYSQQTYDLALEFYQKALKIYETKRKGCFQSAIVLNNIGLVYTKQGKYKEALDLFEKALKIKREIKGKRCYEAADTLQNIGSVYKNKQDYSNALFYYNLALQKYHDHKGKGCYQSADTLHNMGTVYKNLKQYKKALQFYDQALKIKEHFKGPGCIQTANTLRNIGQAYFKLNNHEEAEKAFQSSMMLYKGKRKESAIKSAMQLVNCLKKQNKANRLKQIIKQYGLQHQKI